MVSRWTPYGFYIHTMWFPCEHHVVPQVDTMWFLNLFQLISVRMANLIHILGTESMQDPTKVKVHIRVQMANSIVKIIKISF